MNINDAIYEASRRLNRSLDLNEIYQAICDSMSVIAPNDILVISAFDPKTKLITCRAYWMDNRWLDVSSFPAIPLEEEGKGTQSLVIRSGNSMLINDYQSRIKSANKNYYVNAETNEVMEEVEPDEEVPQSALIVALKDGDVVTGVIQVMSYQLNAYTEDQLKTLEALALHIVSAEKNANLYVQVQAELNERKQAEEALHQSELQFRALFELSPDAVMLIDPHDPKISWPIIDCNEAACLMNGYRRDELIGHTVDMVNTHPASESERSAYLKQLRETGSLKLETVHRHKNGVIFPIEVSTTITRIGDRELIIGIDRDITERKQAEIQQETAYGIAEAAQGAESLQDLYPRIHEHIGRVMYAENFYIALYDETTDTLEFVYSVDKMDPNTKGSQPTGGGLTAQVLYTGKSLLYRFNKTNIENIKPLGSPAKIWLGVPLTAHGKTIGAMAVQHYTDPNAYTERDQRMLEFVSTQVATVIERKQNEEDLRQIEIRNRLLIENAPDGIVILNADGKFIFDSPSAARMFGYEHGELIGKSAVEQLHPEDRHIPADIRQVFVKTPSAIITRTYRSRHKNGSYLWIEATYTNLLDQPRVKALVVNFRDITEQKNSHEMLKKSQASLENAQAIAHLGSWELDPQSGAGLSWSREMYHLYHRDPTLGVPALEDFMQWVHPDDRQPLLDAQNRAIETGMVINKEYRAFPPNDQMHYFRASIQAIKDEKGQLRHMSGTALDITESRQMELEIKERVKELTCLFNVSRVLADRHATVEMVCKKIVEFIIPAMQFPHLAVPLLTLDRRRYSASTFDEKLTHKLCANIDVNEKNRGQICVYYTANVSFIIPEERDMLGNIARMLGLWLEQRESEAAMHAAQRELEELNRTLEKRVQERTEEVRRSESIYRALFENSNDGIFIMNPNGEDLSANRQALNMLGYTLEEYMALPRYTIITPEQKADADQRFARAMRGEHIPLYERTFIKKNGETIDVEINLSPIRDASGKVIMAQSVVRDITERKKAQEMLRESEEQNRLLFEESPDAIILLDTEGKIIRANRAYEQLTKIPLEKMLGNTADNLGLVSTEMRDKLGEALVQAISRNETYASAEYIISCADGRALNVESRIFLLKLGGMDRILVTTRDITERKKYEVALHESHDQLSAANAALERASRLKDEFLASMSHELRTPLTGILGLSEALQLQTFGEMNEKQNKALKNIEISGRHLLELINDILDLSKIEAGKLEMQFEPCFVMEICQSSLQLMKGLVHQKKQHLSFNMTPDSISIRADTRRLKQMLVNLLSNAVKFTPEGGQLGLDVQADVDLKAVLFTVWDKGIGINPEEMDKLFKPFMQLDSSLARQYSGTGLGLSLVQRMAELHGGSVKVESVPGEGSRFTIILPWSPESTQPVHGLKKRDTGSLKKALVIEDNDLDVEHVIRYLKDIGITHVIQPLVNGALEQAAQLHPCAILLDINMPDGSGLELLAKFKADERTREIPVIITSVEEQQSEAMKLGAIGYLLKPFTQQELQDELAKAASFQNPAEPVMVIGKGNSAPLVMLADDNEMVLEMVSDFLEAHGFRVISTRSGFELLERAPEFHPAVMLVDIQMPGMDGMETMRRLRAHSDPRIASAPIIAVTALAMSGDREKCLEAGANEYVSKPVVLTELVERIKKLLKG